MEVLPGMNGSKKEIWHWQPTSYYLRRFNAKPNEEVHVSSYQEMSTLLQGQDRELVVSIELSRELEWADNIGWTWHKSWNLPQLSLSLALLNKQKMQEVDLPYKLELTLIAVKVNLSEEGRMFLQEVPLVGNNKTILVNGKAKLNGIKFTSTSYNHKGHRFHFLVLVSVKQESDSEQIPPQSQFPQKILFSRISPAFHIDSRLTARIKKSKCTSSFHSPHSELIDPNLIMRDYYKKSKGKNSFSEEIKVENSLEGLATYLSAANIKNKQKGFLFYLLKFSNCLQIATPKVWSSLPKIEFLRCLKDLLGRTESKTPQLYILILGGESLRSFELIKQIFIELRKLVGTVASLYLDRDSVPEDYTTTELGEGYWKAYQQLYLSDQTLRDNSTESTADTPSRKSSPVESIFRVDLESLGKESCCLAPIISVEHDNQEAFDELLGINVPLTPQLSVPHLGKRSPSIRSLASFHEERDFLDTLSLASSGQCSPINLSTQGNPI